MIQKIGRIAALTALLAGTTLSAAGCGAPRYEDCEVDDQFPNGNQGVAQLYESDCGYWERDGKFLLAEGVLAGAVWHWWNWVTVGQNSFPPAGWKPPHGLKPPTESAESKKRRTQHEKRVEKQKQNQVPRGTKNGNQPKTGGGNQGIPKGNNPAPRTNKK